MMMPARLSNWSLRAKLAALLIAASVLPLGISAYVDVKDMREERIEDAQSLLTARAEQIAHEFDSAHQAHLRLSERVASLPAVLAYCTSTPVRNAADATRLRGTFGTFQKSDPAIHGLALIDSHGRVSVASELRPVGSDLSQRPTFRAALKGDNVISPVEFAPWEGELQPTVSYMVPVRDAAGQVVCAMAMVVNADMFSEVLRSANGKGGTNSYAVLTDEWGVRLAHSRQPTGTYRPSGPLDRADLDRQVAQGRFGPRTRAMLEDVQAFPEEYRRARAAVPDPRVFRGWAPMNQTWNYGVARRLTSVPWTVFFMLPEDRLEAELADATRKKILLALVIMTVAAGLGLAFAASILRPVRELGRATAALAAGDENARVPGLGHDELGQLGAGFNAMAARLQAQADELRRSHAGLRKYADELEVANKDLEAFASSVSHDLRAPLHVVDGFSQMLETRFAGQLDAKSAHYLARIRAGVSLMEQLVEGILDLSRLGRQPLRKQQVDVAQLVGEVLAQLRSSHVPVDDRVTVVGELAGALADRVLLRQVFANLLSNACKFTGQTPQPEVRVGLQWLGGEAVYFVRDNGAGFDPAYASRLFEPFQRLHRTQEFAGLGIGLSIVKRIVQRHGGRIWAEAAVGQGACFYFTLGEAACVPAAST
ncbi:MAG: HAMP domain-containing protein [Burkholderiaceae bacterium]|nr:HAMP domain-containing protein [Burkholderiaceae bacterium]